MFGMKLYILKLLWVVCLQVSIHFSPAQGDNLDHTEAVAETDDRSTQSELHKYEFDPNGYVFFCLCMGRFGNQADHFLGGLEFAKKLNRTLIVPPFRTYRNVKFTEWFRLDVLSRYHRVILAEDFLKHIADKHWPKEERYGFCWLPDNHEDKDCHMKDGNPFFNFWDELGVDFVGSIVYNLGYYDSEIPNWKIKFPADMYPVLAMRGAPARFPIEGRYRHLQQYLVMSDHVNNLTDEVMADFAGEKFVGIHLRNGGDW